MSKEEGGYVYPLFHPPGYRNQGLTQRQWLAGLAMQGLLSNPKMIDMECAQELYDGEDPGSWFSIISYVLADALILEGKYEERPSKRIKRTK